MMIGKSLSKIPYHIQALLPKANMININGETCATFFVLSALNICGIAEIAVSVPAPMPMISFVSI